MGRSYVSFLVSSVVILPPPSQQTLLEEPAVGVAIKPNADFMQGMSGHPKKPHRPCGFGAGRQAPPRGSYIESSV